MPSLTWTPTPAPKHTGATDKSWEASVGELPWCGCGKRTQQVRHIEERTFFTCSRCAGPYGTFSARCKQTTCTSSITLCRECVTAQQIPAAAIH
jgi:hypothetical protein